eukprot:1187909-Prorocentrum_minimum.AAC.1
MQVWRGSGGGLEGVTGSAWNPRRGGEWMPVWRGSGGGHWPCVEPAARSRVDSRPSRCYSSKGSDSLTLEGVFPEREPTARGRRAYTHSEPAGHDRGAHRDGETGDAGG